MQRWTHWLFVGTVAFAVAAPTAEVAAAPKTGERFPIFAAVDVAGQPQSTASFRGAPTLVVVITERGAGDAMRAWFEGALKRAPTVRQKGIISIGLPIFVSESYARSKAREQIPQKYWHDNLFDGHRSMAKRLGVSESDIPWVFVLDAEGHIVAGVHALAETPAANAAWIALAAAK